MPIELFPMRKTRKEVTHILISHYPESPSPGPPPREGTEKVPFFYDQNGKCLRFVTSLSANRLK